MQPDRGVRICERNNSADIRISKEGEIVAAVPLQLLEMHSGAEIPLEPKKDPMLEQVDA